MPKYCETTHPQKVMGLYVNLKKALDALEAAGESPYPDEHGIAGITASVNDDSGRWTIVQS